MRFSAAAISSIRGLGRGARDRVRGQEGEPSGIRPAVGQRERDGPAEERVGDLREDPRPVTDERVGAGGTAVVEVAQRGEGVVDDVVARRSPHRRDEGHAARVVLELAAVEPGVSGWALKRPRVRVCGDIFTVLTSWSIP